MSGIHTRPMGDDGWWSSTIAFANKQRSDGASLDAWFAPTVAHPNDRWTVFARAEGVEADELEGHHGDVQHVGRVSAGAIRDWRVNEHAVVGVGAVVRHHFAPDALEPAYGGDPGSAMAFVRLKIS